MFSGILPWSAPRTLPACSPSQGPEMGFIEKRSSRYRARYRDPLGRQLSETFTRRADAERFLREMQVDIERGRWIDPRGAEAPLES